VEPCCAPVLDGALTEPDGTCACELVEPIGRSQPTVSHHLKALREAGLVESERRGTWVWYRVVPERLEALRGALAAPAPARVAVGS